MRLIAVTLACAFVLTAVSAGHAQYQERRAVQRPDPPGTVVVHRDQQGRTRTKILVQKRSYLDGGTEVMPGDNIDPYRHMFLMHRASDNLGRNDTTNRVGPIPDPFFLPGKDNPWPGFMD
jgi:hypothetical protein